MSTVQLRRYSLPLDHNEQDAWISWWHAICEPRRQYGFNVVFAYLDRETGEFTWAVSHDNDLLAAESEYVVSPERAAVFELPRPNADIIRVAIVDVIA